MAQILHIFRTDAGTLEARNERMPQGVKVGVHRAMRSLDPRSCLHLDTEAIRHLTVLDGLPKRLADSGNLESVVEQNDRSCTRRRFLRTVSS